MEGGGSSPALAGGLGPRPCTDRHDWEHYLSATSLATGNLARVHKNTYFQWPDKYVNVNNTITLIKFHTAAAIQSWTKQIVGCLFWTETYLQQEYIPVGCVPPVAVAVRGVSTRHPPGADPPRDQAPPGADTPQEQTPPSPGTLPGPGIPPGAPLHEQNHRHL